MTKTALHLPLLSLFHYGLIALPVAFAGFPIYLLAPDFYATQFGLSLTSLATVLLVLRFIDGIQDPFIGAFSDKFHQCKALHYYWLCNRSCFGVLVFIPAVDQQ